MKLTIWTAPLLMAGLAACGSPEPTDTPEPAAGETTDADQLTAGDEEMNSAIANLQTAEGEAAGRVTARESGDGIMISLNAEGMPPGQHGVHVHMTGTCEAPSFESAGGHWNPTNQQHGLEDPEGQHAGDMPNLDVAEDGSGTLEYTLQGGTFDGLLDGDGSAFIVHASADDQMTDPSGNSGARIACGVFEQG